MDPVNPNSLTQPELEVLDRSAVELYGRMTLDKDITEHVAGKKDPQGAIAMLAYAGALKLIAARRNLVGENR